MIITDITDSRVFISNPSFTLTPEIVEFTKPLKSINLDYFTFDRHYLDKSRALLTNSIDWIRHYWVEKLYEKAVFEYDTSKFSNGYVFWEWLNREPVYSAAALYGIDHGITISEKHDKYYDFFHFGPVRNAHINGEYIVKNLPLIYQFISIFKHKMRGAIQKIERYRIRLSVLDGRSDSSNNEDLNFRIIDSSFHNLFDKKDVERIYFESENKNSWLTKREIDLINLLTNGSLLSDVAAQLGVSEDTVNKKIKAVKNKMNCKTLCEVGFVVGKLAANNAYPLFIEGNEKNKLNNYL